MKIQLVSSILVVMFFVPLCGMKQSTSQASQEVPVNWGVIQNWAEQNNVSIMDHIKVPNKNEYLLVAKDENGLVSLVVLNNKGETVQRRQAFILSQLFRGTPPSEIRAELKPATDDIGALNVRFHNQRTDEKPIFKIKILDNGFFIEPRKERINF